MNSKNEFVLIDGRKVPTEAGLAKMGLLKPNGEFVTLTSKVTDGDYKLSNDDVRTIVWNLKKYSSVTYIKRLREMLEIIANGYEKYVAMKSEPWDVDIRNLKNLHDSIAVLDNAVNSLLLGDKSSYKLLRTTYKFNEGFTGRIGDEYDWEPLGKDNFYNPKSRGLFLWIEKATDMALGLATGGVLTWPYDSTQRRMFYKPPSTFDYASLQNKPIAQTGDTISITGIWNPYDFKSACPAFLLQGSEFANVDIVKEKFERSEYIDDNGIYNERWQDFNYEEFPTRWELLWEDTRYLDGTIPEEEAEYLDESCSFPDEPAEAIGN